ncbi:hypothetical protein SAMN02746095_03671 [Acidocella aminolytica 101 = DSM 11237]|uniref:Insertion sequence n=1 Tax=Acidocella aminolytica 101 = DSM 11237 TaxID=1120923 RepID=A0A0D6PE57_9PROT|nr:insertion sequence [Acidocella aminolytica 101 = DSM 11237]SHF55084.1 hypothetical protein SAMN02746095_03671 [Acidocella aminolytica 101 = DSM 11237]
MATVNPEALVAMLDRLKLTAIRDQLDTLLDEAARSEMNLREALTFLAKSPSPRMTSPLLPVREYPGIGITYKIFRTLSA